MVLLLVFMQLTRDLFAIAKFLLSYAADKQTDRQNKQTDGAEHPTHADRGNDGYSYNIRLLLVNRERNVTNLLEQHSCLTCSCALPRLCDISTADAGTAARM